MPTPETRTEHEARAAAGAKAGDDPGSPGAIPNWQPASTKVDYLRNCREGLEDYSERRLAKLLGWFRIRIHRAKLMAHFLIGFSSSFSPMAL